MNYKDAYFRVVVEGNLEKIKHIISDKGYFDTETINKIQFQKSNNLPHLFIQVDSPDYTFGHYAMIDGIYLDIHSIIPEWQGKFYLGLIIIRNPTNEKIKPFIDPAKDIEHELEHLRYLIDHIDKNPDYIENSRKYNVGSCALSDLEKSVAFEVKKIFAMEVPALIMDFEMGQKDMFSFENGIITKVTVDDKDSFLRYQVGQYLAGLHDRFAKKFPDQMEQIKDKFEREVNERGKELFGPNCMMLLLFSLMEFHAVLNTRGVRYEVGDI